MFQWSEALPLHLRGRRGQDEMPRRGRQQQQQPGVRADRCRAQAQRGSSLQSPDARRFQDEVLDSTAEYSRLPRRSARGARADKDIITLLRAGDDIETQRDNELLNKLSRAR